MFLTSILFGILLDYDGSICGVEAEATIVLLRFCLSGFKDLLVVEGNFPLKPRSKLVEREAATRRKKS